MTSQLTTDDSSTTSVTEPPRPMSSKSKSKLPVTSLKRPTRKKPKDKPKRPLSAYNFFFKEEREKILKLVLNEDPDVKNDPDSDDYIDDSMMKRLRKEGGKVSFEEMGKLIGQRWKNIDPERLSRYSEMAAEDTERYKKEMQSYNGRQEAKMRNEALKPPAWNGGVAKDAFGVSSKIGVDAARAAAVPSVQSAYTDMAAAMQGFNPAAAAMQGYGAYGMDMNAYAAQMGAMYGYGGYGMPNPAAMAAGGDMQSQFSQGMYGQMAMMGGAGFGGMMGYGAAAQAATAGAGANCDPSAAAAATAGIGGFPLADLYAAQAAPGGGAGQPHGGGPAPGGGQWGDN